MPKSFIIILIGLFAAYSASGQNQVLFDSLSEVIESNISDKQKVDAYVELASMYPFLDSAHAVTYAHKAFELAEKVNYVEG